MWKVFLRLLAVLLCTFSIVTAKPAWEQTQILALFQDSLVPEDYSKFIDAFKTRGFQVTTARASESSKYSLFDGESLKYHHVILLASDLKNGDLKSMSPRRMINYLNAGGNVLMATNQDSSEFIRSVASQCGVTFAPQNTRVSDLKFLSEDGNTVTSTRFAPLPSVLSTEVLSGKAQLRYSGTAMSVDYTRLMTFPILMGSPTSYTLPTLLDGTQVVLVAGFQALNNARAIFAGSLRLFHNDEMAQNGAFISSISQWVFKEKSVLHATSHRHFLIDTKETPVQYPDYLPIGYEMTIVEWNGQKWAPFVAKDVQLEIVKVDPYLRATLVPNAMGEYHLEQEITLNPGMNKLRVAYHRPGYTYIDVTDTVTTRMRSHDEHEPLGFNDPYYAAGLLVMFATFIFSFVILYHKDPVKKSTQ